jgi:hypothetical protein
MVVLCPGKKDSSIRPGYWVKSLTLLSRGHNRSNNKLIITTNVPKVKYFRPFSERKSILALPTVAIIWLIGSFELMPM